MADRGGYPVVVRPSYVLGGRGMAHLFEAGASIRYMTAPASVPERPVLIDRFLETLSIDVDAIADAPERSSSAAYGEIEKPASTPVRSCVVRRSWSTSGTSPPSRHTRAGRALKVIGLMNISTPARRHRRRDRGEPALLAHGPYISKAKGVPMPEFAARSGRRDAGGAGRSGSAGGGVFVKSPVFPFVRFPASTHSRPGNEMTGEGMGAPTLRCRFARR